MYNIILQSEKMGRKFSNWAAKRFQKWPKGKNLPSHKMYVGKEINRKQQLEQTLFELEKGAGTRKERNIIEQAVTVEKV